MTQRLKGARSIIKEINPNASARDLSTHWSDTPGRCSDFLRLAGAEVGLLSGDFFAIRERVGLSGRGLGDYRQESDSREYSALDGIDVVGQTNQRFVRTGR